MNKEKIGKLDLEELILLAKKYPKCALITAHGEGLLEGIARAKAKICEVKDVDGKIIAYQFTVE